MSLEGTPLDFATTDLCDQFPRRVQPADPIFGDYGGLPTFAGEMTTVKVLEDNVLVRRLLESDGRGRVLIVDGMASLACALLGDRLGGLAAENGWCGIVLNGCIRDSAQLGKIPIGIRALAAHPRKSGKQGLGDVGVPVAFAGVVFQPGHFVYADQDGLLVAAERLH
ncbi:MAG: ribonuclease E activity regulator RraA [Acidobacteriota bacterium]